MGISAGNLGQLYQQQQMQTWGMPTAAVNWISTDGANHKWKVECPKTFCRDCAFACSQGQLRSISDTLGHRVENQHLCWTPAYCLADVQWDAVTGAVRLKPCSEVNDGDCPHFKEYVKPRGQKLIPDPEPAELDPANYRCPPWWKRIFR